MDHLNVSLRTNVACHLMNHFNVCFQNCALQYSDLLENVETPK